MVVLVVASTFYSKLCLLDNDDLELAYGFASSGLYHPPLEIVAPYVSLSLHNSVFPQYLCSEDHIQVCIFVVHVSKYNSAKYAIQSIHTLFLRNVPHLLLLEL